jgi:hypothetical protein
MQASNFCFGTGCLRKHLTENALCVVGRLVGWGGVSWGGEGWMGWGRVGWGRGLRGGGWGSAG